ncbi:HNH endonuclease signature motif containing protein, partial [Rhodococcus chondri]
HLREWRDGGATDLDNLALVCDADHARITGTDAGWTTTADPHGGRPRWTAPHLLDPTRTRRRNHRHHPHELIAKATAKATAARDSYRPRLNRKQRRALLRRRRSKDRVRR